MFEKTVKDYNTCRHCWRDISTAPIYLRKQRLCRDCNRERSRVAAANYLRKHNMTTLSIPKEIKDEVRQFAHRLAAERGLDWGKEPRKTEQAVKGE